MSSPAVHRLPSSTSVVARLALVVLACISGLAPFTHLVSASSAPIVQEDGGAKSPTTAASDAARRRQRRAAARARRRTFEVRRAITTFRHAVAPRPAPVAAPLLTILRL